MYFRVMLIQGHNFRAGVAHGLAIGDAETWKEFEAGS